MSLRFLPPLSALLGLTSWLACLPPSWAAAVNPQAAPAPALAQVITESSSAGVCPPAALSRFTRHRVQSGETLDAIAQHNNLITATLLRLNPQIQAGGLPVGQELVIPPYNGIVVTVPRGQTWEQVAVRYDSRADVLFEINGCVATVPEKVFVPGLSWLTEAIAGGNPQAGNPLKGYPLPQEAPILAVYGWQPDPNGAKLVFNTGVTLAADPGTPAVAVGEGIVAFAGADTVYGNLVVINHQQGLQTRYANLSSVSVSVGQVVRQGTPLGLIAAQSNAPSSFLFFEVRLNSDLGWVAQDPQTYIPKLAVR